MPNWCYNNAFMSHADASKVDALEAAFHAAEKGRETGPFHLLYPEPSHPVVEKPDIVTVNDAGEVTSRTPSTMPDWWHWRVNNWGTKWEPAHIDIRRVDANTIEVEFDTAWTPPIGVYETAQADGWNIEASYREEGMGFCGEWFDGKHTEEDIEEESDEEDAA